MSGWKTGLYSAIALIVVVIGIVMLVARGTPVARGLSVELAVAPAMAGAQPPQRSAANVVASASAPDDEVPAEMRRQFADVARVYAENARFPDYAKPLNAEDWNLLHPRVFVTRKAVLGNVPGVTATVEIGHSIVDRDMPLPVRVIIEPESGAQNVAAATVVRVMLKQKKQRSAAVTLALAGESAGSSAVNGASQVFAGELPVSLLHSVGEGDAAVLAQLVFDNGATSVATAALTLYSPAARLVQVDAARLDGADLVIPAQFDVKRAGQYRVEANLFDAKGNTPISHLNAEFALTAQQASGLLKVHAVTLRAKGDEGPYVLRDIDITRIPDQPGEPTGYGSAAAETWAVRGFPLDAYSNETYEDPAARQRLEFLQKLAGTP